MATDVAEESITIEGLYWCVDSLKKKKVEVIDGVKTFQDVPISQITAKNRKGRIGRNRDGHLIRLANEMQFNRLEYNEKANFEHQDLREPALVLAKFQLGLKDLPCPPSEEKQQQTYEALERMRALTSCTELSKVGESLLKIPLSIDMAAVANACADFGILRSALAWLCFDADVYTRKVYWDKVGISVNPSGNQFPWESLRANRKNADDRRRRIEEAGGYGLLPSQRFMLCDRRRRPCDPGF